jgi:hypothetical protein
LLAAGDPPHGKVHEAWAAKEALQDLYTFWGHEPVARQWLDGLINDCRAAISLPLCRRSLKEIRRSRRHIIEKRTHHRHQYR